MIVDIGEDERWGGQPPQVKEVSRYGPMLSPAGIKRGVTITHVVSPHKSPAGVGVNFFHLNHVIKVLLIQVGLKIR